MTRSILLVAVGAFLVAGQSLVPQGREGPSQLATYEGKRSGCWLEAVGRLRDGCHRTDPDSQEPVMSEEERKQVALDFTNCQFEDDGLPTYSDTALMAEHAREGKTLAYSVFTHHLLSVESICLRLSEVMIQRAAKEATSDLLQAGRMLASETANLQHALQNNVEEMERTVEQGKRTTEKLVQQQREVGRNMKVLSDNTEGARENIAVLYATSRSISEQLGRAELSFNAMEGRSHWMPLLVQELCFSTCAYFALAAYFFWSCPYLRAPMMLLTLLSFAVEASLVALMNTSAGEFVMVASHTDSEYLVEGMRKVFLLCGGSAVFLCWLRHRNPQQQMTKMTGKFEAMERKLDAVLRAFESRSPSAPRSRRQPSVEAERTTCRVSPPTAGTRARSVEPVAAEPELPRPPVSAPPVTAPACGGGGGGGGGYSSCWAPPNIVDVDADDEPAIRRDSESSEKCYVSVSSPSTSSSRETSSSDSISESTYSEQSVSSGSRDVSYSSCRSE